MAQRRAKTGGERGVNGEWYEGGKFIANTEQAKGHKLATRGTGRQQVAPGQWEVAPNDIMVAIFPQLSVGFFAFDGTKFGAIINQAALDYFGADRLITLRDLYNAGERWTIKP